MPVQALRYNNCQLEFLDDSGVWKSIPALNNCADTLIIPGPFPPDKRCRIAVALTEYLRQGTDAAVKTKKNDAAAHSSTSGFISLAVGALGFIAGLGLSGGVISVVELAVAVGGAAQGVIDLAGSIDTQSINEYDQTAASADSALWTEIRCHLYDILDLDTSNITDLQAQEWLHVIMYGVKELPLVAPHLRAIISEVFNRVPFVLWQALGLQAQVYPTTIDCSTCSAIPDRLRTNVPAAGETIYNTDGTITLHGALTSFVSNSAVFWHSSGSFQFDYFTHCFHITHLQVNTFLNQSSLGLGLPFAKYWPAGSKRTDPGIELTTAQGNTLQDLVGKDLAGFELDSYSPDSPSGSPPPFEVVITAEQCCHDWREEGMLGWQEVGPTTAVNVTFDNNNGMYGLIWPGQTSNVVAAYLQHNRTTPFKIQFDAKNLTGALPFTVLETDTTPSLPLPTNSLNTDGDRYYTISKPYVVLVWNVNAPATVGNPGSNPIFYKFCYGLVQVAPAAPTCNTLSDFTAAAQGAYIYNQATEGIGGYNGRHGGVYGANGFSVSIGQGSQASVPTLDLAIPFTLPANTNVTGITLNYNGVINNYCSWSMRLPNGTVLAHEDNHVLRGTSADQGFGTLRYGVDTPGVYYLHYEGYPQDTLTIVSATFHCS